MSGITSQNVLLRPENDIFGGIENPKQDCFEDFFNSGHYNDEVTNGIKHESDDCGKIARCDFTAADYTKYDRIHLPEQASPEPWRRGLWCLKEQSDSQISVQKTREGHDDLPEMISPLELSAKDSCPSKVRRTDTEGMPLYRVQSSHCHDPARRQRLDQEKSLSPTPMYARSSYDERPGFTGSWQQEFPAFNLELDDEVQRPLVDDSQFDLRPNYSYGRRAVKTYNSPKMEQRHTRTMQNLPRNVQSDTTGQGLSSIMNANLDATNRNMFTGSPDCTDIAYKFINDELPAMSDWTATESLHSSASSHNSHFSASSIENRHPSGIFNTFPPQQFQLSPPLLNPQSQKVHGRHTSQPELLQPKPRRTAHQVLNQDHFDEIGSCIQYPTVDNIGIAIPYQPQTMQNSGSSYHKRIQTLSNALDSYPPLPLLTQDLPENTPFSTPRRRRATEPRTTPSPELSPTPISRSMRITRSPSRRDTVQRTRSKSLHRIGPKAAPETPRQRSISRGRTPRTPKTPQTTAPVGFVNFTPRDAHKLLNDVAPSGSSKTRARRDAEARDRRKKLGEAALAAVKRAGGDVEALERAILI